MPIQLVGKLQPSFRFWVSIVFFLGNVLYQTREQAQQLNLTFINNAGNAVIKVDNTINGANNPTFGRPSIKILSNDTLTAGSLWIMDAVHMPFGVSFHPKIEPCPMSNFIHDGAVLGLARLLDSRL